MARCYFAIAFLVFWYDIGYGFFITLVADNGRGLSHGFDFDNAISLGFQPIKGLAKQLQAQLHIANANGLKIPVAHIGANLTIGKAKVKFPNFMYWQLCIPAY